jgi:hypothetical protein
MIWDAWPLGNRVEEKYEGIEARINSEQEGKRAINREGVKQKRHMGTPILQQYFLTLRS